MLRISLPARFTRVLVTALGWAAPVNSAPLWLQIADIRGASSVIRGWPAASHVLQTGSDGVAEAR